MNRALQNLIVRKYGGRHVWDRIRSASCCFHTSACTSHSYLVCVSELAAQKVEEHKELSDRHIYDDDFTFRLFQEASELCGEKQRLA